MIHHLPQGGVLARLLTREDGYTPSFVTFIAGGRSLPGYGQSARICVVFVPAVAYYSMLTK